MDADTRHQLKQNELAEMLTRLRDWNNPQTRYAALGIALVLVLAVAAYAWYRGHQRNLAAGWQQLSNLSNEGLLSPVDKLPPVQDQLRTLIGDASNPALASAARLTLARTYMVQGLEDKTQRPQAFEAAAKLLEQITGDAQLAPTLRAPAALLLGSAYESLQQPDKAKEIYTKLATDSAFDGWPAKTIAAERLTTMADAEANVTFLPGAAPPPTQPAPAPLTMGPPAPESAPASAPAQAVDVAAPAAAAPTTAPTPPVSQPAPAGTSSTPPPPPPGAGQMP